MVSALSGPCVLPASEVPDPQDLIVSSYVNGEQAPEGVHGQHAVQCG